MKKLVTLFQHGAHTWSVVARDPERAGYIIDTNEYLISNGSESLLTDPGGIEIFPAVFSAVCEGGHPERIKWIFSSHQDPDVISSMSLWLEFNPQIKCYLSWLWSGFVTHFGGNTETFIQLPDEGQTFSLGQLKLEAIPAHYLHSSGNLHLYDPQARILFSGDVGAALLPADHDLFVQDFDAHISYMEGFHRRWMGSTEAKRRWCERVGSMKIDMLCPQHGAIFQGPDVQRFINWFADLKVGYDQ